MEAEARDIARGLSEMIPTKHRDNPDSDDLIAEACRNAVDAAVTL